MISKVRLEWEQSEMALVYNTEDAHFYAFSRGSNLLYIGIAFRQDVIKEINANISAFNLNADELTIWLGDFVSSDYGRITEELVKDVECLLILTHQPLYNTQCKKSYSGRNNLRVKSERFPFFKACIQVEDNVIYDEC